MSNQVLVYCPHTTELNLNQTPPSEPPLSSFHHHQLSSLLFCEECDAIRCNTCVACEISCYYCPNCLFEVPSASVRGEKNRLVASDPDPSIPLTSASASVGESPYYLACSFCRWDSKEVKITFEKPTGLAAQLQKSDGAAPEILEFDRLKDHLEPYLRRGQAHASTSTSLPTLASSSSALPSTSSLLEKVPAVAQRYGTLFGLNNRPRGGGVSDTKAWDELEKYEALVSSGAGVKEKGGSKGKKVNRDAQAVNALKTMTDVEQVAGLDKRCTSSWNQPLLSKDLKPLRVPLQCKRTKRCPVCKHILIKPEQKSSSTRFKIKLVASNYLPSIELYRRPPTTIGSRLSAIAAGTASGMRRTPRTAVGQSKSDSSGIEEEPLRPGRTYVFELSFTNPLYEPIHVRLAVARPVTKSGTTPYAVNLPSSHFPISAYAEDWEYEDDDDGRDGLMEEDEDEEMREGASPFKKRKPRNAPGIVERKMNRTTVMMEVAVGKDTVGPIRANMLVTYVYQSDDSAAAPSSPPKSPTKKDGSVATKEEHKSFSFWTFFNLGTVTPRAETRRSLAGSGSST